MTAGLEEQLRDLLQKNGLLGNDNWKAKALKLKNAADTFLK